MKLRIAPRNREAEKLLPPLFKDGSQIGVNYADAFIKGMNATLADGTKVSCKRKGLKITLAVGDRKGEGIMRRLQHGPDPREILRAALEDAAAAAGMRYAVEEEMITLEVPDPAPQAGGASP